MHPLQKVPIKHLHQSSNAFIAQCNGTHVTTVEMPMLDRNGGDNHENEGQFQSDGNDCRRFF